MRSAISTPDALRWQFKCNSRARLNLANFRSSLGQLRNIPRVARLAIGLILLVSIVTLASCGNGDKDDATPTSVPRTPTPVPSPEPTQEPPPAVQPILPCHADLGSAYTGAARESATPEVVRVQMFEGPYRIVPNNIVLKQYQPYRIIIEAGDEWHHFAVGRLGLDLVIPPGGQGIIDVEPEVTGVFPIANSRKIPESYLSNTVTVIPANMSIDTWHQFCAEFNVQAPPPAANLAVPFVVEGSIGPVIVQTLGGALHVTRIEAWSNNLLVGVSTTEQITFGGRHSDFYLRVPTLGPGNHTLVLKAYLQNGMLVATASLPLTVQPDAPPSNEVLASRGNIDEPADGALLELPVRIHGWAAVLGSSMGTGVKSVEIWNGPRASGRRLTEAVYGTYRPDVAQVYGEPRFASSGWFAQLDNLQAGPLDLYLYVRDIRSGAYVAVIENEAPLSRRITLVEGKIAAAPWPVALAAAPDGKLFFAELLTGQIRIWQDGRILPEAFARLEDVSTHGESGLLGLALHPDYPNTPFVYAMYVVDTPETGLPLMQRIVRFRDVDGVGRDFSIIVDNLPATKTARHNGGRIAFGHDGMLYAVVGDIDISEVSQDLTHLAGSILRYNPDGSVPDDNPFPGSPIYAYGLRSPFGLAFQPNTGVLYATENGPGGFDEVNRVESGHNYGWPLHMGAADAEGFSDPIAVFGLWPETPTYGPTGATFPLERPDLFLFCGYHQPGLHALRLSGPDYSIVAQQMKLSKNCILDVTASSDGWLYYSTISAIYRARLDDLLRLHEQIAN